MTPQAASYLARWRETTLAAGEPQGALERLGVWWNPRNALPPEARALADELAAAQAAAVDELVAAGLSLFSVRKRAGEWEFLDFARRGVVRLPILGLVVHLEPDDLTAVPALTCVSRLGELRTLVRLELSHPRLTDAHVTPVAELELLETLKLAGERELSDAALQAVARLPGLKELKVRGGSFTDAGLRALTALPLRSLEISNFYGEAFSAEAVRALGEVTTLERVRLGLDDERREVLAAALEGCDVG